MTTRRSTRRQVRKSRRRTMKGGDWLTPSRVTPSRVTPSRGSRHLVTRTIPRNDRDAALEEEAREIERRGENNVRARERKRIIERNRRIEDIRQLGLHEDKINIIIDRKNGFDIEYILDLTNYRGIYTNRNGHRKYILKRYIDRINNLTKDDFISFLNKSRIDKNMQILPM